MSVTKSLSEPIPVLDHGYLRFVEAWGHGDSGDDHQVPDCERGIIEAARQSTQASFRGWEDRPCSVCGTIGYKDCLSCEGTGVERGDQRLLKFLFSGKPQHATPFEFSGMTIEVQGPIMVFREWHRHRTQSYNEMSARYAPLPDLNYIPTVERLMMSGGKNKQAGAVKGADELDEPGARRFQEQLRLHYDHAEAIYQVSLTAGVPKELARLCLPVGRYSRMRASANLRNWIAFVTLRSDSAAQWEIRQYSIAVEQLLAKVFPRTYDLFVKRRG